MIHKTIEIFQEVCQACAWASTGECQPERAQGESQQPPLLFLLSTSLNFFQNEDMLFLQLN